MKNLTDEQIIRVIERMQRSYIPPFIVNIILVGNGYKEIDFDLVLRERERFNEQIEEMNRFNLMLLNISSIQEDERIFSEN